MTTCVHCKHWNPKATDTSMLRHGFARCDKKALPGHTVSAMAQPCGQFAQLDAKKGQARTVWLEERRALA